MTTPSPDLPSLRALHDATLGITAEAARRLVTHRALADPERRAQAQALLDTAPPEAVPHPQLRLVERHGLSIRRGLSFRTIMVQRSEAARQAGVTDRAWLLDSKAAGYRFADLLGLRRPAGELHPRPLAEIDPQPPTVVKPVQATGARGVFLVYAHDRIVDVRAGDTLATWEEAEQRARALLADPRRPVPDQWLVEELVLDGTAPARDLKFFACYGEVLFVQEIERLPAFRACFWSPSGERVSTGKPEALHTGYGVTKEQVELVERISAQIPAPFMRIDTLRTGPHDLVVGEFTPRPGQFEEFDADTDRRLAEAWMRAERRLLDDALSGARFDAFEQVRAQFAPDSG